MALYIEAVKVGFGAFLSSTLVSWYFSGHFAMSVLVGGVFGTFAALVYTGSQSVVNPQRDD
jgi:hypothetical protein